MSATIVIPTYERPMKLKQTFDSVCTQTVDEYEIIVVDDGSVSEEQDTVLDQYGTKDNIRVLRQENAGPAAARNRGWRAANGEFVLFTDDDCIVPNDWVESLVAAFEPGIAAVGGKLVPNQELLQTSRFAQAHQLRDQINYSEPDKPVSGHDGLNVAGTANVAYRRSVLDEVGGFDESFPLAAGEDADLKRRVIAAGYKMKYVPIAVRHNDEYRLKSFISRAIRSGEGTRHFHQKYGESRSVLRILAGLVGSPIYFLSALRQARDPVVASLYVIERMLNRWGELRATY